MAVREPVPVDLVILVVSVDLAVSVTHPVILVTFLMPFLAVAVAAPAGGKAHKEAMTYAIIWK